MNLQREFVTALLAAFLSAATYGDDSTDIGYPSTEAALEALHKNPVAQFSVRDGWTTVSVQEGKDMVMWSFTPNSHPAHPAAVKRTMTQKDGAWYLDVKVLCGGPKDACDKLVAEFNQLNARMKSAIDARHGT